MGRKATVMIWALEQLGERESTLPPGMSLASPGLCSREVESLLVPQAELKSTDAVNWTHGAVLEGGGGDLTGGCRTPITAQACCLRSSSSRQWGENFKML